MIDTDLLRKAIRTFESDSRPSSYSESRPATVADINRVRKSMIAVLTKFVDELEKP